MKTLSFCDMGIHVPRILLPKNPSDKRWPVVACDQYTSQPEVWQAFDDQVGEAPSTLRLVLPEIHLDETKQRLPRIHAAMESYLQGTLERQLDGFILCRRETQSGARLGLIAAVDLENYSYARDSKSPIRATEGTILERLPPRMAIRREAPLECSHILLLANDRQNLLLEPLYAHFKNEKPLYDVELMQGGGRLIGWAVQGELLEMVQGAMGQLYTAKGSDPFLAVGDGNHSLATAKALWEERMNGLPGDHPARYALCEITNLYDPALVFEPIHRVMFGVNKQMLLDDLRAYMQGSDPAPERLGSNEAILVLGDQSRLLRNIPLARLQAILDEMHEKGEISEIDYVHGDDTAATLGRQQGNASILLPAMDKLDLFSSIKEGPLPRKAFSMGEANEKRYYMECRRIR